MPQFLIGDELGNIKRLQYSPANLHGETQLVSSIKSLYNASAMSSGAAIQALASTSSTSGQPQMVVAARANKTITAYRWDDPESLSRRSEWTETRMKPDSKFVGLTATDSHIYSCTSNGALRRTSLSEDASQLSHQLAAIPSGLYAWRMSPGTEAFAYGGDEVDLSVWNIEQAFTHHSSTTEVNLLAKRKRSDALLHGEVWRAKNIPNDSLGLRQPIRISSLAYLQSSSPAHLATGTQFGDVRRYDIRAGRKPVSNWKVFKDGNGVRTIEAGINEYQAFVSDTQARLFSVDLRNGSTSFGYKGISGAVTSMAITSSYMASVSLDRYIRIHSVCSPPADAGHSQENKGEVLEKNFVACTPTVVICNHAFNAIPPRDPAISDSNDDDDDDDVWQNMEHADEEGDEDQGHSKRLRKRI